MTQLDIEATKAKLADAAKQVFDPEIPRVSIYDLGLIYEINVSEKGDAKIIMTLTSPNCPAAQELPEDLYRKSIVVEGVESVKIDVVFDPPWDPTMISDAVKLQMGLL